MTSSGEGTLDGRGHNWWWAEILQTLPNGNPNRPKLFNCMNCTDTLVEKLLGKDSPSFHFNFQDVARLVVRRVRVRTDVLAEREALRVGGRLLDVGREIVGKAGMQRLDIEWKYLLEALLIDLRVPTFPLNTDGIDFSGRDVHVHDVDVQNFDDSIVAKPTDARGINARCTENVLVENVVAKGVGLSIGSISPHADHSCIRNVTFRNISMPNTMKGIYLKTNPGSTGTGEVSI